MKLTATLPSKCFVIGEYLVLDSGRALIANTEPRFTAHMDTRGSGNFIGFHPESPAGRLIKKESAVFKNVNLEFVDPHKGRGGFGASSAQFVAAFTFFKILLSKDPKIKRAEFSEEMLAAYRKYVQRDSGRMPSGADVLSQFHGELNAVNLAIATADKRPWAFEGYGFFLVRTGIKLATHEHLANLAPGSFEDLSDNYSRAESALMTSDATAFAEALNGYQITLKSMGLLAKTSEDLLEKLSQTGCFTVAKACGAMGADILFLMFRSKDRAKANEVIESLGLEIVADQTGLSAGLELHASPNPAITAGPLSE